MEELRLLVRRYDEVIQRYYVQFMYGYDSVVLNETVQNLSVSRKTIAAIRMFLRPGCAFITRGAY